MIISIYYQTLQRLILKEELLNATSEKNSRTMTFLKQAVMDSVRSERFQNRIARLLAWSTIYSSYPFAIDTISSLIYSHTQSQDQ